MKKNWKRILAAMLAASMIFGNAVPAYATESQPVVEVVEAETEVAEDDTVLEETDVVDDINALEETVLENVEETTENVTENTAEPEAELANVEEGEPEEILIQEVVTEQNEVKTYNASGDLAATYIGTVESTAIGNVLYIRHDEAAEAGAAFDNATILSALEARIANSEYFAQAAIFYPEGYSTTIPADIWNSLIEVSDTDMRPARFEFDGGDYVNWEWKTVGMEETSLDVKLNGSFNINTTDGTATLTLSEVEEIPTSDVYLRITTSKGESATEENTGDKKDYADIVGVFGTGMRSIEVFRSDSSAVIANGHYQQYGDEFNCTADILLEGVNYYLGNGTYTLAPKGIYTGTVEEDSNGNKELYIRHWEVTNAGGTFDDATILAALQARIDAGESFEQVIVSYPDIPNVVDKDVWNAVRTLMNNDEYSAGFCFSGGDYMDENWFVAGMQEATKDVVLDGELTLGGAGELGNVRFENTNFPANAVHIRFNTAHWNDEYSSGGRADYGDFVAAFGTESLAFDLYNKSVAAEDSSARYEYYSEGPGNDNLTVAVDNIGELRSGVTYTLEKKTYKGETDAWDDGTTIFRIAPWGFEECGETFTEEGVINILKGLGTTKFDRIEITYPLGSTEVSATVWNTAVGKIITSKNRELMIGLEHNQGEIGYDWNFGKPEKTDAPINLVVTLNCGNAGEYGTICFEETAKPAERVNVNFYTNSDRDEFGKYESAFGTESHMMDLVAPSGETVSNAMGHYNYYVNEEGNGPSVDMNINFMDIYNLTSGTTYTIAKHVYKGDTGTWDDGQRWLNINPGSAGKEFLTDEDVKDILANYEEGTFREITIQQNIGNELSANLVNEARKYLAESTEEMASELRIGFWNDTDNVYYQWCIENPGVQQDNQTLSLNYTASADWEPKVKIGRHSLIGDQVWVHINIDKYENRAYYDWTINSFGAKEREIVLEGPECPGWFSYDEWSAWLDIRYFEDTDPNTEYKIIPKVYRGEIHGDEEWQSLFVSAYAFENNKLTVADVESIIKYHKDRGTEFDAVEFEQISTGKNVIDKDIINLAREILKEDSEESRMTFIFCGCEEVEPGRWTQNDWNWTLVNPGIASKDINATVTSSIIENKGVTVKFVANTYSADEVFVSRFVSEGTDLADAYHNALTANTDLMLLKKSSEVVKNRNIGLYTMGEDEDTALEFFVGNVQNLAAATEYLICDTIYLPEIYAVGNPEDMTTVLSNSVDEKTSVTWKVYSPEKTEVTADGEIKFLSGGGEHFFSAQYKSGGKTIFEFFHAEAELRMTKLAFEKSNYDVEFWPDSVDEEWANRGHLDVKYYPSNAGMDPADLIWKIVNGEDVVRFVPREEDGKFDGEIQGLSIGTATIKVTHPENADLTETVTVNVVEAADYIPEEAWEEMEWLYAFANVDKTLADVELPEGWEWENPKQSLKNYYDSKGGEFEAIYTKASGQEAKGYLHVEIFKLEEVFALAVGKDEFDNLFAMESPKAMEIGESITWGFDFKLADDLGWDAVIDEIFAEDGKFSIKWSDNLSEIDETSVVWRGESVNYEDCRMFKASTKGTYKFNVSLVDNETSKAVAKYSWSVKVVDKDKLVDFDQMIVEPVVGDEWNKGELHFLFPVDEYVKISSVKSSDSKVYALGKNLVVEDEHVIREIDGVEVECVDTWVTYEEKASGVVVVTVTAADDAKSTWTDTLDIIEREPKVLHPSVEINKAYADKAAVVNVQFADNFPYAEDSEGIRVVGEYAEKFEYYHSDNRENGWLVLEDATLAKGTYKVQLSIPVDRSYDGEDVYDYSATVKVKVTDKAPTVKIKQTKNVNLFYTNQSEEQLEGTGAVTIDIGTLDLSYAPFIYEDENVDEDFELVEVDGEYRLIYAPNDDDQIDKNVDIKIGVTHPVFGFIMLTKTVKIKTENKAPALVLSTKTDTLYPKQYVDGVEIYLKDKVTGEKLSFEEVAVVDKKGENVVLNEGYDWENPDTIADFVMSKNKVYVGRITDDYTKVGFFMIDHDNAVNSTEKFTLRVCKENWSNPVNVTYTLKIATKAPKLTLGSSKLTLNMNEDVRNAQYARTTMTLANCSSPFWSDVYFVGADAKSKEALNKAISLEYDMNRGEIVARLNVSESHEYQLKKGTYSFKVWADNWIYKTSTTLKVAIVDTAPEKCIKLSKKGSIDLLQKDSKRMEFTPKLSNLDGTIVDAWIEGPYDYAFDGYFEDGKLVVGANIEYYPEGFNTKHNYSITPVFVIENSDGWHYEVRAAAQSVKVTQSKPKVTVNAYNGNTLYTLAGNSLPLEFNAAVKNTDITIKDVKLLNYTDDLEFEFYEETGTGVLSRGQVKQITTNGKSWSLKFAVTFVEGAGNERPVQVTYKVTIK